MALFAFSASTKGFMKTEVFSVGVPLKSGVGSGSFGIFESEASSGIGEEGLRMSSSSSSRDLKGIVADF